uniref:Uncharacterized protein n=1 Tax=Romanomermis culicivorax TaxID=13658 RepID=A0A915KQ91_ROMCU
MLCKVLLLFGSALIGIFWSTSGSDIYTSDANANVVCMNGQCFNGTTSAVKYGNCPLAACSKVECEIKMWNGCPICTCGEGSGTTNPCETQQQCQEPAVCENQICTHKNVPTDLPKYCVFDYQCGSSDSCVANTCSGGAVVNHVQNVSCISRYQCPKGYYCKSATMTCYEDEGVVHLPGVSCLFQWQCPEGYVCDLARDFGSCIEKKT